MLVESYWALEPADLLRRLRSSPAGLSSRQAAERLRRFGRNELREQGPPSRLRVLLRQLRSPLLLLLVFAAVVAVFTGEWLDAVIVLAILVASVGIGYHREYGAERTAAALGAAVRTRARVLRDGAPCSPYLPRIDVLGVVALPAPVLVMLVAITLLYVAAAETTKRWFYRGTA
jgi:Mg2+-importing ATPase